MFYNFIKIWGRLGLFFFFRKISFNDRTVLKRNGPLLLACNHPNSFLDAIIIGSHFKQPVHFLARGDVFRNPLIRKILSALKMIPIYRLGEGREHLALNDATFEQCGDILGNGGIVLIFAEGLCVNQWALRRLKKGAARIAWTAFNDPGIRQQLSIIPVGINYNGFGQPGKRVIVQFEKAIGIDHFHGIEVQSDFIQHFNGLLQVSLQNALLHDSDSGGVVPLLISNCTHADNKPDIIADLKIRQQRALHNNLLAAAQTLISPGLIATTRLNFLLNMLGYILLMLPAVTGWLLHIFLLYPLNKLVRKKTNGTVFYDSVMFGSMLLLYPVYWIFINSFSLLVFSNILLKAIVCMAPLFAIVYLVWMDCAERTGNYILLSPGQRKLLKAVLAR